MHGPQLITMGEQPDMLATLTQSKGLGGGCHARTRRWIRDGPHWAWSSMQDAAGVAIPRWSPVHARTHAHACALALALALANERWSRRAVLLDGALPHWWVCIGSAAGSQYFATCDRSIDGTGA